MMETVGNLYALDKQRLLDWIYISAATLASLVGWTKFNQPGIPR